MKTMMLVITAAISFVAIGSETFKLVVRDQNGAPIQNAKVVVKQLAKEQPDEFWAELNYDTYTARTDANGRAEVKFNVNLRRFDWNVEADGYYCSWHDNHEAFKARDNDDDDGITLLEHEISREATLYRKVNPQPMVGYGEHPFVDLPSKNGHFGFDLESRDWVTPHGAGKVADFFVNLKVETNGLVVVYTGGLEFKDGAGAYLVKQTGLEAFPSTYRADPDANYRSNFLHTFKYQVNGKDWEKLLEQPSVSSDEFLVMRTRVKRDDQGKLLTANYSKMVGEVDVRGCFRFREIVFNPRPNDINLEFDSEHNLGRFGSGGLAP